MHVPLRLDVYYQHPDSRRELLERWCLEYAPKSSTHNGGFHSSISSNADPIVQLRHVCKQIVVWLRTLYCWSRMLPAQALRQRNHPTSDSPVGFSIYVVSEGNDDVSGLVQNQGFFSQGQPHSVLTPYGELGWRVFYAPKSIIESLFPETPPYQQSERSSFKAISQPIPMKQQQHSLSPSPQPQAIATSYQQQQQQHQTYTDHHLRRGSTPPTTTQSAPNQRRTMYARSHSDVVGERTRRNSAMPLRSNSGLTTYEEITSVVTTGISGISISGNDTKPPTKNLSGLSLAMMQNDEDVNKASSQQEPSTEKARSATPTSDSQAAEKRRAALHHAPPQFSPHAAQSPIMKRSLASAGDYGYGYNNLLTPTLHRNPSNSSNNSHDNSNRQLTPSPSHSLAATPPGVGYLYGVSTSPAVFPSNLIPPRSAVTPPFVRPMGFQGQPTPTAVGSDAVAAATQQTSTASQETPNINQHTSSLDLLHSSPFHQQPRSINISTTNVDAMPPSYHNHPFAMSNDVHTTGLDSRFDEYYQDDMEDMPFAVDAGTTTPVMSMTAGDGSSAAVAASFAANPKRLALFDTATSFNRTTDSGGGAEEDIVTSLVDQLADFKTFGASLMIPTTDASPPPAEGAAGPVNAPISLRT